jgi:hypothetical protein
VPFKQTGGRLHRNGPRDATRHSSDEEGQSRSGRQHLFHQRGTRQRRKDGLRNVQGRHARLTRQLALEPAGDNITVNSVAPGPVDTATARAVHTELTRASYLRLIPMRRYGRPEEVAAAVSFLCSKDAAYITGHTIPVYGGFLAAGVLEI